jgi:NAD(P)-dependent dehydrogenase (short-subunit alcohol dehydrogenase family)
LSISTNVLGLILATQEAVCLFAQKGGSIINIGTAASQAGAPNMVLYLATPLENSILGANWSNLEQREQRQMSVSR